MKWREKKETKKIPRAAWGGTVSKTQTAGQMVWDANSTAQPNAGSSTE